MRERIIEVTIYLYDLCSKLKCLSQLSWCNFSLWDKHFTFHILIRQHTSLQKQKCYQSRRK